MIQVKTAKIQGVKESLTYIEVSNICTINEKPGNPKQTVIHTTAIRVVADMPLKEVMALIEKPKAEKKNS